MVMGCCRWLLFWTKTWLRVARFFAGCCPGFWITLAAFVAGVACIYHRREFERAGDLAKPYVAEEQSKMEQLFKMLRGLVFERAGDLTKPYVAEERSRMEQLLRMLQGRAELRNFMR